ncbi:MAG: tyrosine-type recombinase/integrase, partial [Hominisplanchenecus sp.]|nr:tyrosine-type recombinase/integrase [Hominisplanchenecus sp.]
PKVTPHVCRHTYCTNMAKSGISAKTLQYLMGHSDIQITLNVYTHIGFDYAKEELNKMPDMKKELKSTTRRNGRKVVNM